MDIREMFERMRSGEVKAHSEMGTRDESKQMKTFAARFQGLKMVTGIKAHALVMKDVVIPFNPFTCAVDDDYGPKNSFRPILLVSQVLAGIKEICAKDSDLAAKWEHALSVEPGQIKWDEPLSMDDYFLFKRAGFIKPRVTSYSVVPINFAGVCGFSEFTRKYTVDPADLNEGGSYDYDNAPIWHKAAIFFNAPLRAEFEAKRKTLEKNAASKEQISAARQEIFAKAPVRFVRPLNLLPFIYVPINEKPVPFKPEQFSEFERCIRYYSYDRDKWATAFKEAQEDNQYDENMDFYDFTIRTPDSTQLKSDNTVYTDNDVLALYKALTITNTDSRTSIWSGRSTIDGETKENAELYSYLWAAARAYFEYSQEQSTIDGGDTFEKLMAMSNKCRPITSVMDKFLPACNQVFLNTFADNPYFTEEVKKQNSEFFIAMNSDNAMALAEVDDDELKEASQAQAASISALIQEANADVDTEEAEPIVLSDD